MDQFKKWFKDSYHKLDGRFSTMEQALELVLERFPNGALVIETGCARQAGDWGAGLSTVVFCDFLRKTQAGRLISVDIEPRNVATCEGLTAAWSDLRTVICSDSVEFLNDLGDNTVIDFLYLDSWDYPIIEIGDEYGTREQFPETLAMLNELTLEEFLARHGERIAPSQNHCLKEIKAAMPHLSKNSVVLIDDVSFPGGGKSRLAEEYLRENGWVQIVRAHQSLWVHGSTTGEQNV